VNYAEELAAVRAALQPQTVGVLQQAEIDRMRELIAKYPTEARKTLHEVETP
jgi:hypothetical protein